MSEKTEPPTEKKIRDAREKGQFLFSREIVAGSILIALTFLFLINWQYFIELANIIIIGALSRFNQDFSRALPIVLTEVGLFIAIVSFSVYGVSIITAIIANVAQTGVVFLTAKIKKGIESVNFIKNAKQMFAPRNLFNFGMNLFKVLLISYVSFLVVKSFIGEFFAAELCGLPCVLWSAGRATAWLLIIVAMLYVPVAILDFIFQRVFYMKELKMTKEEVKREFKEMEGDPEIKAQRQQAHRDILDDSMLGSVSKASVIIKNPMHYAVALLYDEEKTPLPLVIGKGQGAIAHEIIKIAERENIPIYEDIDLAQGLFMDIELGHYITSDFIMPVAEALRYIQQAQAQA